MQINYLILELFIISLFLMTLYFAKKVKKLNLIIYATLFAIIFENINIHFFNNYYYSSNFNIYILYTPLFVILSWGMIILSSFIISEKLFEKKGMIFAVPILALLIDLAIEIPAVQLGFWTWTNYQGPGFLSIDPTNFIGWIGTVFGFITIYLYTKKWLSIFLSYLVFLVITGIYHFFRFTLNPYYYLIGLLILFCVLAISFLKKDKINKNELILILTRIPYLLFGISIFFMKEIFSQMIFILILLLESLLWYKILKN